MTHSPGVALDELLSWLLPEPWHADCEVIPDYMPPHPRTDTRPCCVVRHTPTGTFLRYSKGPRTGTFWDIYGDDFQTPALAVMELSKAPPPRALAPLTFRIPLDTRDTASSGGLQDSKVGLLGEKQ